MIRQTHRALFLVLCLAAICGPLRPQAGKTVTVRMLDSRTGVLIASSDYLVRINQQETMHGNWVVKNEDGSGKLTLPADAATVSIRATYDANTVMYVNCDAAKDTGSSERAKGLDRWYKVSEILASGVVAPNGCTGKKIPDRLQVFAKPGEFVFFVRKLNPKEQFEQ